MEWKRKDGEKCRELNKDQGPHTSKERNDMQELKASSLTATAFKYWLLKAQFSSAICHSFSGTIQYEIFIGSDKNRYKTNFIRC
jgi:hypothetical protein